MQRIILSIWSLNDPFLKKKNWIVQSKVHKFWEGHKILRNLHLTFVCMYCRLQKILAFSEYMNFLHNFYRTIFFQNIILCTIVQWCNWVLRHEPLSSNLFEKITCHFFYKRAAWSNLMHNDVKYFLTKCQLILKCLFGVFTFFQKMNKNKSISSKVEFVC